MVNEVKLLWIGIDGFSFRMVERWGSEYFRRLRDSSQFGISRSVLTDENVPLTGPNWATLYTGARPETHGITDAGGLLENLKYQDIRVNTVFDVIDRHHTQSLMTLALIYPAFPVNGWMLSGFPTPSSLKNCSIRKTSEISCRPGSRSVTPDASEELAGTGSGISRSSGS